MSTIAPPKPDLAAYDSVVKLSLPQVVKELCQILGPRLVAYIAGVTETRRVHDWVEGKSKPRASEIEAKLRVALRIALSIREVNDRLVAQSWFQGLNPQLDEVSPARLLREGSIDEVGVKVVHAGRAFLVGG